MMPCMPKAISSRVILDLHNLTLSHKVDNRNCTSSLSKPIIYIHIYIYTYKYIQYIYTYIYIINICTYIYVYIYIYIYVYIYMYIYVHIYIYIHTYIPMALSCIKEAEDESPWRPNNALPISEGVKIAVDADTCMKMIYNLFLFVYIYVYIYIYT
jgi:hypothetical protein